jgi:hypothetical protein
MLLELAEEWKIEHNELFSGEKVEDLFQALKLCGETHSIVLDAGWYQSIYKVVLIKDFNWAEPIAETKCKDIDEVVCVINSFASKKI